MSGAPFILWEDVSGDILQLAKVTLDAFSSKPIATQQHLLNEASVEGKMNFVREAAEQGRLLGVVDTLLKLGNDKVTKFLNATLVIPINVDMGGLVQKKRGSQDRSDSSFEYAPSELMSLDCKKRKPNNPSRKEELFSTPPTPSSSNSETFMKGLFGSPDFVNLFNTAIKSAVKEVMGANSNAPIPTGTNDDPNMASPDTEDKENEPLTVEHGLSDDELKEVVNKLTQAPMPRAGKFNPKEAVDFIEMYRKFLKFAPIIPPNVRFCECAECIRCRGRIHHNHVSKNLRIGADCSCGRCRTHRMFQIEAARLDYVAAICFRPMYDLVYPGRKEEFNKATKSFSAAKRNRFVLPSRKGSAFLDFGSFDDGPKL